MEQNHRMDFNVMGNNNQDARFMNFDDVPAPTPIGMPFGGGPMPNMMNARERNFSTMRGMQPDGLGQFHCTDPSNISNESDFFNFPDPQPQVSEMMKKRKMDNFNDEPVPKRMNFDSTVETNAVSMFNSMVNEPNLIAASTEGIKFYSRNDVLCGRGGGTNVHPGNRRFRDLINANRRAYLKARKNDKPAISRSIVRTIREMNGRFLKKDEKLGLWFEIGDDGAREKTSQALRQRAPEMRKILFDDEQRQQQQQEALLQRRLMGPPMTNFNSNPSNQGSSPVQSQDLESSLLARYNMLHQKNLLAQEKNMLLQRLAMSGMNPQAIHNQQANIDNMTTQTLLGQGLKPVTPRGA